MQAGTEGVVGLGESQGRAPRAVSAVSEAKGGKPETLSRMVLKLHQMDLSVISGEELCRCSGAPPGYKLIKEEEGRAQLSGVSEWAICQRRMFLRMEDVR